MGELYVWPHECVFVPVYMYVMYVCMYDVCMMYVCNYNINMYIHYVCRVELVCEASCHIYLIYVCILKHCPISEGNFRSL